MSEERDVVDDKVDELFEEVREMDAADGREGETPTLKNLAIVALSRLSTLEAEHSDLEERVNELDRRLAEVEI